MTPSETAIPVRILVVEDRPADAELMLRELRRAGFAPQARFALTEGEYAEALDATLDVILCDFRLPGYDALRALAILRERKLHVPLIVVTGTLGDERAAECMKQGAIDFVRKDRLGRLGLAVTNALERTRLEAEARGAEAARRETERKLAESNELFREITDSMLEVFFVADIGAGRLLYVSPAFETISGRSCGSAYDRPGSITELIHPDDRERCLEELGEMGRRATAVEFRLIRDDGSTRWIEARTFPVRGSGEAIHRATGIAQDVTEARAAADALREREKVLDGFFQASPAGMAVFDRERRFLRINEPLARIDGPSVGDHIGRTVMEVLPELGRTVDPLLRRVIATGQPALNTEISGETPRAPGVLRHWVASFFPIVDSGGHGAAGVVVIEVTEIKRAQEELRRALVKAQESDRLKSAFLANISHEVRTPLNVILGYNALIASRVGDVHDELLEPALVAVDQASHRLLWTVQGIIDLSRIMTGTFQVHPTVVKLAPVLEKAVEAFRSRAAAKGLALDCEVEVPEAEIAIDEYCLRQAVEHLLDNALKFTEQGGVAVTLRRRPTGVFELSVRDTGIGVDAEYLPQLFMPFSQQETGYTRRFEGSGNGLALVRHYLVLNGAEISVESEQGRGTTFTIRFSGAGDDGGKGAPPAAAPPWLPPSAPATATAGGRPLALVVEDDEASQCYMAIVLQEEFDVLLAASADEARTVLVRHPDVALLLMDLSLEGGEDGLDLTRWLRAQPRWSTLPIIATTARALSADKVNALSAGCTAYLAKPFSLQDLLSLVGSLRRPPARLDHEDAP